MVRAAGDRREVPCRRLEPGVDRRGRGSWGPESLLSRTHVVALGRQCGLNVLARVKYVGVSQEALLFLHRLSESVFMKTRVGCLFPDVLTQRLCTSPLSPRNLFSGRIRFSELHL